MTEPSAQTVVTRFAPSPSGELHLGHAFSALYAFERARLHDGRFLLRIEDIDAGRCKPEFEDAIKRDLAWLGLEWEEPTRRQSAHMHDYRAALEVLSAKGLLYPCFCTRREIREEIAAIGNAPHGPDGALYPGTCRTLTAEEAQARVDYGEPYALRLDCAAALALVGRPLTWRDATAGEVVARPEEFGDVVLARKDGSTSYHIAVTVDDDIQGVTLVTRGEDLFHATHVHRLLQALLNLDVPGYDHHPLVTTPDGKRLAKRDRDLTLRALRAAGHTPAEVRRLAGLDLD